MTLGCCAPNPSSWVLTTADANKRLEMGFLTHIGMQLCGEQHLCWVNGDYCIENNMFLSAALLAERQTAAAYDEISETTEPQIFPQT